MLPHKLTMASAPAASRAALCRRAVWRDPNGSSCAWHRQFTLGLLVCCLMLGMQYWQGPVPDEAGEHYRKTLQLGMNESAYLKHLADKACAEGKETRPSGMCCFYQGTCGQRVIIWSFVLTCPLLIVSTAFFSAWRMMLSPTFDGHAVPLEVIIGVSAIPCVLAVANLACCIAWCGGAMEEHANAFDDTMFEKERQIDLSVKDCFQDGTIQLLSCACRGLGPLPAPLVRCQDLPPEAFLKSHEAVAAHERGEVYVLSYGWATPHHPDPEGAQAAAACRLPKLGVADRAA